MARIKMYTTPWCGYCAAARELLRSRNVDFVDIDVSMNSELRQEMTDKSGSTTVPQIFINDHYIGGYSDMAALDEQGELDQLLNPDSPAA